MSDYEYEEDSDNDGEYHYSDGDGEQNTDSEDAQTVGLDSADPNCAGMDVCGGSNGKGVHRLCDLKFPQHAYTAEVQRCLQRGLVADGKAVIVDYW
jgi:hypothetical protein